MERTKKISELRDWIGLSEMGRYYNCPFSSPTPCRECIRHFPRGKYAFIIGDWH